jgi:glycosyltransferase involved in cell wall biosynthesis
MPGFVRNLFSILSPLADGFIFSSESSKAYYEPLIWKKRRSFVIPAPVDTNLFNPLLGYSGSSEFRSELQNKVVIGTLCNISPIKGLETFIRAASILTRDFDDVFFQVVGPVYKNQKLYFANLLDLCKGLGLSNIEFLGATQDVQAFMSRIDIYVCSSLAESSPMAVWEAMAMEKPVVSTAVGDVPLHVNCGQSGYIVNVNDSVALADSIARLVKDAVLRRKLGAVGRQVAIEKLDLTRCANSHFNAYSETVSDLAGSI